MTKTFKVCTIFFISTLWLVLMRIVFNFVSLSDNISDWLFSFLVQIIGMGVIPIVLFRFWVKEDIVTGFSVKVKLNPMVYLIAVALGFLMHYLTIGVSAISQIMLRLLGFTHVNSVGTIYSGPEVLVMAILCTAVLPAIFEEITDRGLAMNMLSGIQKENTVIILLALIFALAHQNIMQTGYTFVAGLVFAYLAVKTKSIVPGMIIHFINNAWSVFSGYSDQTGGALAKIEDKLYQFINNNFILALFTWVLTGIAIAALLIAVKNMTAKKKNEECAEENQPYFYPAIQSIDQLFSSTKKEFKTVTAPAWYEYAFLYAALALAALTTVFTFLWGLWR